MLSCEGQKRKPVLEKLWFVASWGCHLVRICMWGRRSSMWAVQLFLSGELVRAVVFEAGAPWCWWRCSLFACALHLTQLCFGMGCAVVPVAARILEQKVKQALALPARCS